MANDKNLELEFQDVYELNSTAWYPFLQQAQLDLDYYHKAQHTEEERDQADKQDRVLHTIDKLSRQVNLLHGYEIRNRHIMKIGPVGAFDEKEDEACNQHTGVIMSLMAAHNGYDVLSDAFKWGTLVQGSNLIEQWRDRDGEIQYGRLGYNQFLLDHGLTKTDLSDCGDILTGQWISSEKARMLVPTKADDIDDIEPLTHSSRWEFQATPAQMNKAGKRLFEQWWRRETEEVSVVQHRITGQKMTLDKFKEELLESFGRNDKEFTGRVINELRTQDGLPMFVKFREPKDKITLKIFVDDKLVWKGDNPTKMRDYNYSWVHGNWCPEAPRTELKLQSYVRGLRDPQRAFNRRINQIYDIIESQIQGLRIVRSEHLMNFEDAYRSGQGVVLQVKNGTDVNIPFSEIFQQFPASDIPPGLFAALEITDKAETEAGGLNQEIFGSDDKDIPGVLHAYRTGQALTGQAWMFQDMRGSKRDMGRKNVQLVQLNYDEQRVTKILNQPVSPGFYDEDLTKFDCNPTEGLLTDSQQNMYYLELKELLREFPDLFNGIITAEMLVKASPMQFKNATLQAIVKAEQGKQQAGQAAQQQEQLNQQLQQGLTAVQISQANENMADAAEKRSQIPLNNAKTVSEINKNLASPLIDLVKEQVRLAIAVDKQKQVAGSQV